MNAAVELNEIVPLTSGYGLPSGDLGELLGRMGSHLFSRERPLVQYVAWAISTGLIALMEETGGVAIADAPRRTPLNEGGADALLGILCALGLASRGKDARYRLTDLAREYLLPKSPFYIGKELAVRDLRPHPSFLQEPPGWQIRLRFFFLKLFFPELRFGSRARIVNQHVRNLVSCAAAVRTGEFASSRCVVDIAGGSGTLSIPLALEQPQTRVILAEIPQAIPNIRPLLRKHGLENRIELLAFDAFRYPWDIPACDGIFMGNFLHGFTDATCQRVCQESFERLPRGGRIWIHELLWNESKEGPLITAMWNAAMRTGCAGRQRTAQELLDMLQAAGFEELRVVPTSGYFALLTGRKP